MAIVSLSGGMDSVTVLSEAVDEYGSGSVQCVGFQYGSKHNPFENEAARQVASHYGVPFELIDLTHIGEKLNSNLLRSGDAVPEGHYQEESMRQTVVPGRNLLFISVLTALAQSRGVLEVWLGIHSGDHFIYPDCRPEFFHSIRKGVKTAYEVELCAPFLMGDKTSIIQRGLQLGTPYHLTRTCYTDQVVACGRCGSCQERLEAFRNNGVEDPIEYVTREALPKSE